ncbi:MAG: hypothetical protein N5P05_002529 [Chroococcopsis gigantea SAG 12.99]|jgi:hypothetical protein|nr:hypothetical protein [Chroococcopsis gigantea SAG 12.99]
MNLITNVLSFSLIILGQMNLAQTNTDDEFAELQQLLQSFNFRVLLEPTPVRGAYGMLNIKTRTIWIHPVVFDLGIARPTLIHEATHAAQLCKGGNKVEALGLRMQPPPMTRNFFMHYEGYTRQIEAEAYTIQVQPDGLSLVTSLLKKYCSLPNKHYQKN